VRTGPDSTSAGRSLTPRFAIPHSGGNRPDRASLPVPGLAREIRVRIATERGEREQAYVMLAASYRARGYEAPGRKPFRFTPYHALPETVTLIATDRDRVVATLSLVPDSDALGLPMEAIYGSEVAQLRKAGLRSAEAICLADVGLSIREFIRVFKALIKLAMQYHASRGGDCWVITVNPRHSGFYQKVLGFTPLGPQRSYPRVQDHPAEAYLLTTEAMAANAPAMYREVFETELPAAVLTAAVWSEQDVRYFGARSTQLNEHDLDALVAAIDRGGPASAAPGAGSPAQGKSERRTQIATRRAPGQ
jgi:hypothetical protein